MDQEVFNDVVPKTAFSQISTSRNVSRNSSVRSEL